MICMLDQLLGMFLYGVTTFLSPCSISLMTVYLTYSVGVSKSVRKGLAIGCSFAVAMCLVFFVLGYAISSLVPTSIINSRIFFSISGLLLILFGINNVGLLGKLRLAASSSLNERLNAVKLDALARFSAYNYVIGSFLFGLIISIALGPCTLSLVLPAILLTLFTAPSPFHGGLLLLMFGLGHALPVVFLSTLVATARRVASDKIANVGEWLNKIFGFAFIAIGIALIIYGLGGW
jgi:cytochrome c biogenesis protein CcdA